ncbi:MAG: nuclear transport factor 2 family protein [Proteobacteria bacterium]|nr:nuclear transport factor 2 family protein [Pseudomonadota bacterium]
MTSDSIPIMAGAEPDGIGRIPEVQEVADRLAIHEVLSEHCRGVDRADQTTLESCYWPDASVEYGAFVGGAHRFCGILPGLISRYLATQHRVTNVTFRFAGPSARVESYVTAYHLQQPDQGGREMTYLGRYLDLFARRGDVWKLAHRKILMDWNQHVDGTVEWHAPGFEGIAVGGRAPDDIGVRFLNGDSD